GFTAGDLLKIIDVGTGAVKDLCDAGSRLRGATWNTSGTIVFGSSSSPLRRISADGGAAVPVTVYDPKNDSNHIFPQFLPDGKQVLYWIRGTRPEISGIYAASLEVAPGKQIRRQILATPNAAFYAPATDSTPGQLLFLRGRTLF